MSSRNTGLFVAGHLTEEAAEAFRSQGIRVGHSTRRRKRYTHLGISDLEEGGSVLFDQLEVPEDDGVVLLLKEVSVAHGKAVLLFCDDETGAGGHVLFEKGALHSRRIIDGRAYTPVERSADSEQPINQLDNSDWVWPLIADALEQGARSIVGMGIRDDDDIESLIEAAGSMAVEEFTRPSAQQSMPEAQLRGRSERVGRLLGRIRRRLKR